MVDLGCVLVLVGLPFVSSGVIVLMHFCDFAFFFVSELLVSTYSCIFLTVQGKAESAQSFVKPPF